MTGVFRGVTHHRMWPYHPDLLATPVPRYTSYPTAAEFGDIPNNSYRAALERTNGDISLYVHIPFCDKICFYCGCNTAAAGRQQRLQSYIAALKTEIALVGSILPTGADAPRVGRIAFGGGSPNSLSPQQFVDLVACLDASFSLDNPTLSVELDPRGLTQEWTQAMQAVGVERASMGVQTFAPHCQKAIGREQDDYLISRAVDWLRDAGVSSLNFDLMYGLPEQTQIDLVKSLHRTRELHADRVALFGYAHVPHIVARQKAIDATHLPDQTQRFQMAELGYAVLREHGYQAVGFDHFALPGDPLGVAAREGQLRRNFQGFTDDRSSVLIGLGSSAISSFPHLLAQNEKNSGRYRMLATEGRLAANRGIARSAEDRYRGAVIERLLCDGRARIGGRLLAEVRSMLAQFIERGLCRIEQEWLVIQPQGLPYARTIAAQFDPYRSQSARRFSSAV